MKLGENFGVCEASLSRLWQHTQDKGTFAIIGTQDKDTKEIRYNELMDLILQLSRKQSGIGYNNIEGTYTYGSGETGREDSVIIYNISKEDAIRIGKAINQETIIFKDEDFFGMINLENGAIEMTFNKEGKNMKFGPEDTKNFASALVKGSHRKVPFVFECYFCVGDKKNVPYYKSTKYLLFKGNFEN